MARESTAQMLKRMYCPEPPVKLIARQFRPGGKPTEHHGSMCFFPVHGQEELFADKLGLEDEEHILVFPTAGFFPIAGKVYECLLRRRGRKVCLAFPWRRWQLGSADPRQWRPDLIFGQEKYTFTLTVQMVYNREKEEKQPQVRWNSRHRQTGHFLIPMRAVSRAWEESLSPEEVAEVERLKGLCEETGERQTPNSPIARETDMGSTGYALRPVILEGFWVIGPAKEVKNASEAALMAYDAEYAREASRRSVNFDQPPLHPVLGERTPWEIFGSPGSASNISEATGNVHAWLRENERWVRSGFLATLHPDVWGTENWPATFTEEEKTRSHQLLVEYQNRILLAHDWTTAFFDWIIRDRAIKQAAGVHTIGIRLPQIQGREPRNDKPLRLMEPEELCEYFIKAVRRIPFDEDTLERPLPAKPTEPPRDELEEPPVYEAGPVLDTSIEARTSNGDPVKAGRATKRGRTMASTRKSAPKKGGRRRKAAEDDEE